MRNTPIRRAAALLATIALLATPGLQAQQSRYDDLAEWCSSLQC